MSKDTTEETQSFGKEMWDMIKVIVEALLIAVVIRTFIFGLVVIPSASMVPTLLIGDYLYVSKYAYGYSKHSFPFSAGPFDGRIFGSEPKRGDIVVFKGAAKKIDYIKRLVGLPGDKVQMKNGILQINGKAIPKVEVPDFDETNKFGNTETVKRFVETLPNGVVHNTIDYGNTRADNTNIFEIPKGHYFMMGDSRDNSNDSRFQESVRMVAFEDLIGRADFILISLSGNNPFWHFWKWPNNLRTERLFKSLDSVVK